MLSATIRTGLLTAVFALTACGGEVPAEPQPDPAAAPVADTGDDTDAPGGSAAAAPRPATRKFYHAGTAKLRVPNKAEMDALTDEVEAIAAETGNPMSIIRVQMPDGREMIVPGPGFRVPSVAVIDEDGNTHVGHGDVHAEGEQ